MKNRRGFTLVEMVIVIAIIVMLAGVTMAGVSQYSKRAKDLKANVDAHQAAVAAQDSVIDGYLTTTRAKVEVQVEDTSIQVDDPEATTESVEQTSSEMLPPESSENLTPEEPAQPQLNGTGNPNGTTNAPGASVNNNGWGQISWSTGGPQANYFVFYAPGASGFNSWTGNANVSVQGNYVILQLTGSNTSSGNGGQFSGISDTSNVRLVYFEKK